MTPFASAARATTPHAASAQPWQRLTRLLLAAVALVLFCAPAAAQPAIEKDFPLPPTLAGFRKGTVTDFEVKKAGLGYGIRYEQRGWAADIYIYDLGMKSIPSGPNNGVVAAQLEQAKRDIFDIQKAGAYSGVQMKRSFEIKNAAGNPVFSCIALQLVRQDIGPSDSFLCLTAAANNFVKVRISTKQSASSRETAERFVSELAGVIPAR